jgi:hypothetical protein
MYRVKADQAATTHFVSISVMLRQQEPTAF